MINNLRQTLFYILAVFFDTLSFYFIFHAGIGANTYGVFSGNFALLIPISIGAVAIVYDMLNIGISSILSKKRLRIESLLYGLIFAVFYGGLSLILPAIGTMGILPRISFFITALALGDLAKSMLNLSKLPILSSVLLIYAVAGRFKVNLSWASKITNLNKLFWGIILSFIAGVPFYLIGWGTLASLLFAGVFLKIVDPYVKKTYNKIIIKQQEAS
jgi:uncharacterized membrane protein YczE